MTQSLEQLRQTQVARWSERVADWEAFADAKVEGYRRAQHRCEEAFFIPDLMSYADRDLQARRDEHLRSTR